MAEVKQEDIQYLKSIAKELVDSLDKLFKEKSMSLEDVRAILARKARDGHIDSIKQILTRLGVEKLSDVNPKDYPKLVKEVEELQ